MEINPMLYLVYYPIIKISMKKDSNLYNLMTQLVQEQKSLWRIKDDYMKDAGKDKELKSFWAEIATEKELLIEDLKAVIAVEMEL